MTNLGLVASLVGNLVWPATVAGLVLFFRQPLIKLIGRIKSAQVAGQSFEFGPQLEEAEDKTNVAVSDSAVIPGAAEVKPPGQITEEKVSPSSLDDEASVSQEHDQGARSDFEIAEEARSRVSKLALDAEANPSFTVLRAWEELSSVLADQIGTVLPEKQRSGNPLALLPEMQKGGMMTPSYIEAVQDVRRLRNAVAHGQHNPTPGEAIAYVETISKLVFVAVFQQPPRTAQ
jgi:hypothetical protein